MSESKGGTVLAGSSIVCTICGEEKPETDFYMQARDGYKPRRMKVCKVCHKERVQRNNERYRQGRRAD